jgi:putative copper export protein/mono/diheme cytochrome c family protein
MVLPPFDLQGGVLLCAARLVAVCGLLSVSGTLGFDILVAPAACRRMEAANCAAIMRRLLWLSRASLLAGLLGLLFWLLVQTADMASAESLADGLSAIPTVLQKTSFGHILSAQFGMMLVLAVLLGWRRDPPPAWRRRAGFGVALCALAMQAGHSHAYSMYDGPSLLLLADVAHLLGAGLWLGGLPPLILLVAGAPPRAGATAALRFSPYGQICVGALLISAAYQGWVLVASLPGLVGTSYGWVVLVKLALFAFLLCFAAANRYRFAPALWRDQPQRARVVLLRSIGLQTGFALLILAAATVLSELPPAMHEQPLWPFPDRISLSAVQEDADFRREVVLAALALGGGLAMFGAALVARRFRLAALGLAAAIAWFAVPHFDLLLAEAFPTSFYRSPTGFAAETISQGETVFARNCVSCHGQAGAGDGVAAKSLPVPPADLTAAHLWMHSDGELFWWISHGMQTPEGAAAMPGFAGVLDDDQVWAVIDYIHAHNAGLTRKATGTWSPPMRAPGFQMRCGEADRLLSDFRGRFVRLVIGKAKPAAAVPGVVSVVADTGTAAPAPGMCLASDPAVIAAYAVLAGIEPSGLNAAQFLIDGDGWLRAMQPPSALPGWNEPETLRRTLQALRDHSMPSAPNAMADMKMPM